jgi:hypothetical protein
MTPVVTTKFVLVAVIVLLTAYDVFAYWWGGPDATLSEVIVKVSDQSPIVPLAAGLLCGHLFWRS